MKHLIYNPGDEFGFVYSSCNTIPNSGVNFLALNVPREKAEPLACCIITNMAHFAVSPGIDHGHMALGADLFLVVKRVDPERRRQLNRTHTTATERSSTLYELVPKFDYKDPKDWGTRPKFPDTTKEHIVDEIIDKWYGRSEFLLSNSNLPCGVKIVDVAEALLHVDDWNVDWDKGLTKQEIELVRQHNEWFSRFAEVFLRKPRGCACCKKLWEPGAAALLRCGGCKQVYYCNSDCQHTHWKTHHKKWCKKLRSRLDADSPDSIIVRRTLDDYMQVASPFMLIARDW